MSPLYRRDSGQQAADPVQTKEETKEHRTKGTGYQVSKGSPAAWIALRGSGKGGGVAGADPIGEAARLQLEEAKPWRIKSGVGVRKTEIVKGKRGAGALSSIPKVKAKPGRINSKSTSEGRTDEGRRPATDQSEEDEGRAGRLA